MDKDAKAARDKKIFDLWMQCYTQQEIADVVGETRDNISKILGNSETLPELPKPAKASAGHATDFKPPLYNAWKLPAHGPVLWLVVPNW